MIEKSASSVWLGGEADFSISIAVAIIMLASVLQIAKFVPTLRHAATNFAIRTLVGAPGAGHRYANQQHANVAERQRKVRERVESRQGSAATQESGADPMPEAIVEEPFTRGTRCVFARTL
ncbi:MAG TPA: hypothetical protein VFZ16_13400 [Hyphomicrobiaceae bacterium]|nr:hypothetical protein [Hyphomicrobiaceae bacterium]